MAQPMASTSVIPQGVGAPPPPGLDPKRGKLMCIKVRMLDDTVGVFHLGHKAIGQALFDEVCRHLNLLECDYFGLEFLDCYGNHCWLDKDKAILRQITSSQSDARFYFVVKFYSPNPADLEEEYTRYLFALQIKRDLATGQFACNENTGALMASYVVQSECGDFSDEDYPDHTYLSTVRFLPNQTPDFEVKVMDNHRKLVGMSPSESDLALLETARRCDFYGVKFHPARDIEGTPVNLAILHLGIRVYHQLACASTFSWAKVRKMSFKRKKFLIKLHPEAYHYYKDTIEFVFETRNESKAFWKKAVEHHTFFRCSEPGTVHMGQGRLFSKGSSFRYNGRTQQQLIDYVREHHKRREPFTRPIHSAFARASMLSATGTPATPADRPFSSTTPLLPHRNGNGHADPNGRVANHHPRRTVDGPPGSPNVLGSPRSPGGIGGLISEEESSEAHYSAAKGATISFHVPTSTPVRVCPHAPSPTGTPAQPQTTFGASHNSARGTLVSSPPIPADHGAPMSRSLVLTNAALCAHAAQSAQRDTAGTSWPPQPGYLSADNEDNLSEDSYQLSDQECLPGSMERNKLTSPRSPPRSNVGAPTFPPSSPEASPRTARPSILKRPDPAMPPAFPPEEVVYASVRPHTSSEAIEAIRREAAAPTLSSFAGPRITYPEPKLLRREESAEQSAYENQTYGFLEPSVDSSPSPPPPPPVAPKKEPPRVPDKPKTYGAVGPAPGRILSSNAPVLITADNAPKTKPVPPPKPKVHLIKPSQVAPHLENSKEASPQPPPPPITPSEVPQIEVNPVDRPDIQHKFMLNGEVPYVLHMRHVTKASTEEAKVTMNTTKTETTTPLSTFREGSGPERGRGRSDDTGTTLPRLRKKSLDLVQRKRLPSPGAFSSQDHSVSPTTPESGNVLDYLLRRRSTSQDARARRAARRAEGRRKTQPVRFAAPEEAALGGAEKAKSSSQPELPLEAEDSDEDGEDVSLDGGSLHEEMEALERLGQSATSLDDSTRGSIPPPPPPLTYGAAAPHFSVFESHRRADPTGFGAIGFIDDGNGHPGKAKPPQPHTTDF